MDTRTSVVISGARIVDGSGNPWFHGDIVLRGDSISEVAPAGKAHRPSGTETIDATGLVVGSPGTELEFAL